MLPAERTEVLPPPLRVAVWRVVLDLCVSFCIGVVLSVAFWAPLPLLAVVSAGVRFLLGVGVAGWAFVERGAGPLT